MKNKIFLLLFFVLALQVPSTVRAYQYVGNDPINKVDPLGLRLYGIGGSAGATLFLGGELNLHLSYDTDTGKFGVVFTPNFRIGPLIGASANVSVIVADNGGKSSCPPAKIDDLKGKSRGVAADFGPIGSISASEAPEMGGGGTRELTIGTPVGFGASIGVGFEYGKTFTHTFGK